MGDGILEIGTGEWYVNRAKYIPLRLSYEERKTLRLVIGALTVSDYTNVIDGKEYRSENKRLLSISREVEAFLGGILTACDYKHGQAGLFQYLWRLTCLYHRWVY